MADDGPGIDPEDLPRVFERLYTSRRQPGRKVGTGLGLAIVRELVDGHGRARRASARPPRAAPGSWSPGVGCLAARGRVDVVAYDGGRVELVDVDVFGFGFVELVVDAPGGRVVAVVVEVVARVATGRDVERPVPRRRRRR